jgi:hypothetical protein
MFRAALFCKLPFFTTLFTNCAVDKCSETILNPISAE